MPLNVVSPETVGVVATSSPGEPGRTERRQRLIYWAFLLAAFLLLLTRRPDAFTNPQFFAEDSSWYAEAYNRGGLTALFIPRAGYLNLVSRIVGALVQPLPLAQAPLVFNTVGLLLRLLPVAFLLSSRFDTLIPNRAARYFLAVYLVALPDSSELHAILTNGNWHLALAHCLLFLARPDPRRGWRAFDIGLALLAGLSGPFAIFLTIVGGVRWFLRREPSILLLTVITGLCALVQIVCILFFTPATARAEHSLGISLPLFCHLVGGKIMLTALLGDAIHYSLVHHEAAIPWNWGFAAIVLLVGTTLTVIAFRRGPLELKLFLLFGVLMCAGALIKPQGPPIGPPIASLWQNLAEAPLSGGARYWFLPMICFVVALVSLTGRDTPRIVRTTALALLALTPIGMAKDWRYFPWWESGFRASLPRYEAAPPGTPVDIPALPDAYWTLHLIKH